MPGVCRPCDTIESATASSALGQRTSRGPSFELLELDDETRSLIVRNALLSELRHAGRDKGMRTLHEDGLQKVCAGITTIEEVMRVAEGAAG